MPPEVGINGERVRTGIQYVSDVRAQTAAPPAERPARKRRYCPASTGVSLDYPDSTAETLGSPPLRTEADKTVVLTNTYVAALISAAGTSGDVYQLGPADGGEARDAIGTLAEFSPIAREEPNATDSALIVLDSTEFETRVLGIGPFAGFGVVDRDVHEERSRPASPRGNSGNVACTFVSTAITKSRPSSRKVTCSVR